MPSCNFAAWIQDSAHGVAVIGASGWIGSAVVDQVLQAAPDLPASRLRLFAGGERTLVIRGRTLHTQALDGAAALPAGRWLIVHAGVLGLDASDGRERNDALLSRVLDLSATVEGRLVALSSGAARAEELGRPLTAYAAMKRDHEAIVADWCARHGRSALTPRVFNLGGPYITCARNYALGDFLLSLSERGRIEMSSGDPVFRSFVHVTEMAGVLLDMAVDEAQPDEPFDVGGAQIVELGALALAAAQHLGLDSAAIARPSPTGKSADWYVGDARRYQTALFAQGLRPTRLVQIVADTATYLRQTELMR